MIHQAVALHEHDIWGLCSCGLSFRLDPSDFAPAISLANHIEMENLRSEITALEIRLAGIGARLEFTNKMLRKELRSL